MQQSNFRVFFLKKNKADGKKFILELAAKPSATPDCRMATVKLTFPYLFSLKQSGIAYPAANPD